MKAFITNWFKGRGVASVQHHKIAAPAEIRGTGFDGHSCVCLTFTRRGRRQLSVYLTVAEARRISHELARLGAGADLYKPESPATDKAVAIREDRLSARQLAPGFPDAFLAKIRIPPGAT